MKKINNIIIIIIVIMLFFLSCNRHRCPNYKCSDFNRHTDTQNIDSVKHPVQLNDDGFDFPVWLIK